MEITFDMETLDHIRAFESITGSKVMDCVSDEQRMVFVVPGRTVSLAIGKNGANVRKLRDVFGKNVDIVEHSKDPEQFVRNVFHRFRVKRVDIRNEDKGTVAYVHVESVDKGKAIGRGGSNLKLAVRVVKRHSDLDDLYIH